MNYAKLLNTFEDYSERTGLPAYAQLIYYKLFALNNRARWAEWFEATNPYLMSRAKIADEKTFIKHRNLLKQHELIDFISGKKGQPTKYKLIKLYSDDDENTGINPVNNPVNNPVFNPVNMPVQMPVEPPGIYKYKYKQKENINSLSCARTIELITSLVNRPLSSADYRTIGVWLDDGLDDLIIAEAVKKAIVQDARSPIAYADTIIIDWDKRGLKTIGDVLDFLKQEKKLSKREQDDIERRRLTEEYDRKYGKQDDSTVQSKLPSVLWY